MRCLATTAMRNHLRRIVGPVLLPALIFIAAPALTQTRCLNSDEVKQLIAQLNSTTSRAFDRQLSEKLVKLEREQRARVSKDIARNKNGPEILQGLKEAREKTGVELCSLIKQNGWPTHELAGEAGANAAFFLLRNDSTFELQAELLPVIITAVRKGEASKADFAHYVDRLRLGAGLKQLFGTQATIQDGFLVLFPIEAEAQVDERRKQFNLPPLHDYLRGLEMSYRLPLIKSTGALTNAYSDNTRLSIAKSTGTDLFGEEASEGDVIRVETNLVSLNVSVYDQKLRANVSSLDQADFKVFEDQHEQTVTYFNATSVPFDLVLLIDLSGSTSGKRNLIRKSTQRFIEAARPSDRLAIVTFSDTTEVVCPLTQDRKELAESVKKMDSDGGTRVWDAVKLVLDQVLGPKTSSRRRAVVLMSDGVDNAFEFWGTGSQISFADLLEAVRRSDALIIPIYLDTEGRDPWSRRMYENARNTLKAMADESGGLYYRAKKLEDLDGVYQQVIDDLGKVYSLGYRPTNDRHDRSWREVRIEIRNHPELVPRTRPGYYAY